MKGYTRFAFFIIFVIGCAAGALAGNKTYYSKVSASCDSGEGKVYVSLEEKEPQASDFSAESERLQATSSGTHSYYLYAMPNDGLILSHWEKDGVKAAEGNPALVDIKTSSESQDAPVAASYVARFITRPAVLVHNNMPEAGTVTVTPVENKVGDTVTLKATPIKDPQYNCINIMIGFDGWEDEDGNIVSTEREYTFVVERPIELTAVFRNKNSLKPSGYYRVRNLFNRVLTIEGNYKYEPVGVTQNYLDGLLRWSCPDDINVADFHGKLFGTADNPRVDVESLPAAVMYIEGTEKNLQAGPNEEALTNVNAFGQGTDIKTMTGRTFTLKPMNADRYGYYMLYGALNAGFKMTCKWDDLGENCNTLLGNCKPDDAYSAMALQPIDEEHFDEFWFGASASKDMEFEGGYWTSMYTGFPYECRDGVEAYYATETVEANGTHYVRLVRIESGQVPAYSAVLLKCRGERSRENRLMPLDFNLELPALEGNLLTGIFQLYTNKELEGHVKFDPAAMRVLGTGSDGSVGFYKLAPAEDGSQAELRPNKVYLDMTKLSAAAAKAPSLRLVSPETSGIENVALGDGDAVCDSGASAIYDLYGRRVANPIPGTIYVVNGKKTIWRSL